MLQKIANTIRHLTMDAVELAGSGHPGMPMGCAELGAYLFGEFLRFDPAYPKWSHRSGSAIQRKQSCIKLEPPDMSDDASGSQ